MTTPMTAKAEAGDCPPPPEPEWRVRTIDDEVEPDAESPRRASLPPASSDAVRHPAAPCPYSGCSSSTVAVTSGRRSRSRDPPDLDLTDASVPYSAPLLRNREGNRLDPDLPAEVPTAPRRTPCPSAPPSAVDADNDGFAEAEDCDDLDPRSIPTHPKSAMVDNDCDGDVDDLDDSLDPETQTTWYADADGDGWGNETYSQTTCIAPDGHVGWSTQRASTAMTTTQIRTPLHQRRTVPILTTTTAMARSATGTWMATDLRPAKTATTWMPPSTLAQSRSATTSTTTATPWTTTMTGLDTATRSTFYVDADGDGFGDETLAVERCFEDEGAVSGDAGFDCDDDDETINPDAIEVCDELDNDCDGDVDDDDDDRVSSTIFYIDHDGDGHGSTDYSDDRLRGPRWVHNILGRLRRPLRRRLPRRRRALRWPRQQLRRRHRRQRRGRYAAPGTSMLTAMDSVSLG